MFKVDRYFDVTCSVCGRSLSTDFGRGMAISPAMARKWAKEEGFSCKNGRTVCRDCAKALLPDDMESDSLCFDKGSYYLVPFTELFSSRK